MADSNQQSEPEWTPAEKVRMGIDSDSGEYGLQEEAHAALNGLLEQLRTAETTLAHAEAFIEHQDMSYRWAEWCEGRDPNPASEPEGK